MQVFSKSNPNNANWLCAQKLFGKQLHENVVLVIESIKHHFIIKEIINIISYFYYWPSTKTITCEKINFLNF